MDWLTFLGVPSLVVQHIPEAVNVLFSFGVVAWLIATAFPEAPGARGTPRREWRLPSSCWPSRSSLSRRGGSEG